MSTLHTFQPRWSKPFVLRGIKNRNAIGNLLKRRGFELKHLVADLVAQNNFDKSAREITIQWAIVSEQELTGKLRATEREVIAAVSRAGGELLSFGYVLEVLCRQRLKDQPLVAIADPCVFHGPIFLKRYREKQKRVITNLWEETQTTFVIFRMINSTAVAA